MSQTFPHSYALKRNLLYTALMDTILHSIAEHLYLQIDANFILDVQIHNTQEAFIVTIVFQAKQ
jgi:hypothetical protein